MFKDKICLLFIVVLSLLSTDACKDSKLPQQPALKNLGPFAVASGSVNFALTPTNNSYTNIKISVSEGSSFLPVTCSYFIYNQTTSVLLNNLYITKFLDENGATEINLINVLCSNGNTTSYVTWTCNSALYPYLPAVAVNQGGNSFYFNCPQ